MVGGQQNDSNVTNAFGPNTTNSFSLESCTENCDIDAGFSISGRSVKPGDLVGDDITIAPDLNAEVKVASTHVQLTWEPKVADPESYYEITKVQDNGQYEVIARMLGGLSEIYTYNDYDMLDPGLYGYKIIHRSIDEKVLGKSELNVDVAKQNVQVTLYPNPVSDYLTIRVDVADDANELRCTVYDSSGAKLSTQMILDLDLSAGEYSYEMDVTDLHPGIYYIHTQVDDNRSVKKIIITR